MKTLPRAWLVGLAVFALPLAADGADEPGDVQQWFRDAAEKMRARHFAEAGPILEKVRAAAPESAPVEWTLGLAYAEVERHEDALVCWQKMRKLEPDNWQATTKVVQALQALGRLDERDQAIAQVLAERQKSKDPQLARVPWFCREQFKINDRKVLAVEYFNPTGPRAVFAAFLISGADGKVFSRYSLGSYDSTTEVARSTKEIGPQDRLYHLDYYENGEQLHRTCGFFKTRPDYAALRDRVVKAMTAELKPISESSAPARPGVEKK